MSHVKRFSLFIIVSLVLSLHLQAATYHFEVAPPKVSRKTRKSRLKRLFSTIKKAPVWLKGGSAAVIVATAAYIYSQQEFAQQTGGTSLSDPDKSNLEFSTVVATPAEEPAQPNFTLHVGAHGAQGHRKSMEDAELEADVSDGKLLAVFDGHGGSHASSFAEENFASYYETALKDASNNPAQALQKAIAKTEDVLIESALKTYDDSGTTAVIAYVKDDIITVANVGDSRLVFFDGNKIHATKDHNPKTNDDEIKRVEAAGGRIFHKRVGHPTMPPTMASIAVSRALGDIMYKADMYTGGKESGLIATPEMYKFAIPDNNNTKFIILACDGLWDVMTNDQAVNIVQTKLQAGVSPENISKHLVDQAIDSLNSRDNVTVMIVEIK